MTDRPKIEWTDEELRKAWPRNTDGYPLILGTLENTRAYLKNLGAVHPADAREREREAALWGYQLTSGGSERTAIVTTPVLAAIDRVYPSLTPPPPPALRLSTGEWRRDTNGVWLGNNSCARASHLRTASDARAFAAWLAQYGSEEERK